MKKIISLLLCLMLMFALFGCANKTPAENSGSEISQTESSESSEPVDLAQGKTIACCMGSIYHPVHRVVQYGFCTKSEELGMIPIVSGLDEGSMQELIDKWNSDIASNNAVGALIWTGDDSCYEMMKELKQQGIYTVVPYFCHDYENTKSFIDKNPYYDTFEFGVETGEYIVDELAEKNITNGTVVVTHHSNQEMIGYTDRIFEQAKSAGFETIGFYTHMMLSNDTERCVEFINEYNEKGLPIVAVVALGDTDANAWVNAQEQTNSDILIIAQYKTSVREGEPIPELLKAEKIDNVLYEPLYESGVQGANALYELINGAIFSSETTWYEILNGSIMGLSELEEYIELQENAGAYFEE